MRGGGEGRWWMGKQYRGGHTLPHHEGRKRRRRLEDIDKVTTIRIYFQQLKGSYIQLKSLIMPIIIQSTLSMVRWSEQGEKVIAFQERNRTREEGDRTVYIRYGKVERLKRAELDPFFSGL